MSAKPMKNARLSRFSEDVTLQQPAAMPEQGAADPTTAPVPTQKNNDLLAAMRSQKTKDKKITKAWAIPESLAQDIELLAKKYGKNQSQLVTDILQAAVDAGK